MGPQDMQPQPSENPKFDSKLLFDDNLHRDVSKVILVAEDNVVNQKIATLLLEKLGLSAQVVANGIQALEAVRTRDYPVVLMDCHMPEMDGFEATRAIRRMEMSTGKHTPIIAVTALAMAGDRERCIEAGMDDYISKPIDKERLKNKLNQWMNKEFVFHNQKLAERFFEANARLAPLDANPIDIAALEVFYGSTEEVEEVLRLYVTITERNLPDLEMAVDEHRATLAGRLAHELKGSSASVGAKELSLLCLQLEQEIGQQSWDQAKRTFLNIGRCFESVRDFVGRTFKKSNVPTIQ
jgi:CheY-like chemotaxis protein/HPt (histidine-containing phosphotransfer) domain-containing protein